MPQITDVMLTDLLKLVIKPHISGFLHYSHNRVKLFGEILQ